MSKTVCLLWMDDSESYEKALKRAEAFRQARRSRRDNSRHPPSGGRGLVASDPASD